MRVGVDHLGGRHHRVGGGLALHRDAELGLGAHDPPYAHGSSLRGRVEEGRPTTGRGAERPRSRDGRRNDRVVPHLVDVALRATRSASCAPGSAPGCSGQVLEIGFGSGLNARFYPSEVTGVSAVEPSDVAWRLSEQRRQASDVPVTRSGLDGQHLAEADASHDAALVTFSLCTIADPALALREVRRVVRPGGRLHFLEHGLAPEPGRSAGSDASTRCSASRRRLPPHARRARHAGPGGLDDGRAGWLEQAYLPGPAVDAPGPTCPWASRPRPDRQRRPRRKLMTARTTTTMMAMMMMVLTVHSRGPELAPGDPERPCSPRTGARARPRGRPRACG